MAAIELSKDIKGIEIEYIEISPLPFLNTDLEIDGTYPPEVEAFRHKILAADSILFASPEYNYSLTGTYYLPFFSLFPSQFISTCIGFRTLGNLSFQTIPLPLVTKWP